MTNHPDHDPATGGHTVLSDRYELTGLIGSGGMAEVYRGRDLELGRPVAVKLMSHDAAGESYAQRLRQEARAAASLKHPGVVAIYDVGETGTSTFVVMEHVEGETLRATLARHGTFTPDATARIGEDVCAALDVAHRQGVVHRDINPGNIMLGADGSVKVVDFGIARIPGAQVTTQEGTVLGTPGYLSPEQARGDTPDARTDLYSWGCCLYEMATGQQPFTGESPASLAYQHIHRQPREPRTLNPNITTSLQATIFRAMAKDPGARYPTAAAMAADLAGSHGADVPPVRNPPGPPESAPPATATTSIPSYATLHFDKANPVDGEHGTKRSRLGLVLIVISLLAVVSTAVVLAYRYLTGA